MRAQLSTTLATMLAAQQHRGPDGQGIWIDADSATGSHVYLGHRRLAIIAPGPLAEQPMHSAEGRYTLVLNGAIYNFVELATELGLGSSLRRSDTAVLLAAWERWGPGCLNRLNGMFAFAVWDARERTLHLCRDRFGEKPLHYVAPHRSTTGLRLAFASEAKALIAARLATTALDPLQLCEFLASYDIDHHPGRTLFADIHSVEPGCYLRLNAEGRPEQRRYYHVPPPRRYRDLDGPEGPQIVEETSALLHDAIRLRLRSDVPLAGSLSGGLDSSLVTALVLGQHAPTETRPAAATYPVFSCQFPDAAGQGDESGWAQQVVSHLGLHDVNIVTPRASDLLADLSSVLLQQEAPFADTSIVAHYALVKEARARGIKVLLSGQGGDEIFLGYPGQLHALAASRLRALDPGPTWRWLRGRAELFSRDALRLALATGYHALPPSLHQTAYAAWRRSALPLTTAGESLLTKAPPRYSDQLPALCEDSGAGYSLFDRYVLDGIARYSLPHILRHDDRNSMAVGIESRAPYLDHRLLEHLATIREASLLGDGLSKRLLRSVAQRHLPAALTQRPDKRGFFSPQRDWLWHPACEQRVRQRCYALPGVLGDLLDGRRLRALLDAFYLGRRGELAGPVFLAWVSAEFVADTLPRLAALGAAPSP